MNRIKQLHSLFCQAALSARSHNAMREYALAAKANCYWEAYTRWAVYYGIVLDDRNG